MPDLGEHLRGWSRADGRCLVIGEVAQAHDGSLGMAHAYIDAIADAGADAVKFQTHIAAEESTPAEPWRVKFSRQDASRYDYWRRMEFTEEQWLGLREHADDRGILFLSSPFSVAAVDLLTRVGVAGWKVASGEVGSRSLWNRMLATGLPWLISTGMSSWPEIDRAVRRVREADRPMALLQCTTAYPCPPEKVGLHLLTEMHERYGCPVGLSDHSGTIYPGLAAATIGCAVLEVHVTFSRRMFGPDVPASVTVEELAQLVEGVRYIERMKAGRVDKDASARELATVRNTFRKSIVAAEDLAPGTRLEPRHLAFKKPGTGLTEEDADTVLGRVLRRPVKRDQLLAHDDFE